MRKWEVKQCRHRTIILLLPKTVSFSDEHFASEIFWEKTARRFSWASAWPWWSSSASYGGQSTCTTPIGGDGLLRPGDHPVRARSDRQIPGNDAGGRCQLPVGRCPAQGGKIEESTAIYPEIPRGISRAPAGIGGARLGIAENYSVAGNNSEAITALKGAANDGRIRRAICRSARGPHSDSRRQAGRGEGCLLEVPSTYQGSPLVQLAIAQVEEITPVLPPAAGK